MIMSQIKKILITMLATLATACAPTLPTIRHASNWYQLGEQDALKGNKMRSTTALQAAISQLKQPLNIREYQDGWAQGSQMYCSSANGYRLGEKGIVYNNICPDRLISDFDHAWQRGLREYCTQKNGYHLGELGKPYSGFCPPDLNAAFQKAYNQGYKAYQSN